MANFILKPSTAIGGDDQVATTNLKGMEKRVRTDLFSKRAHTPYGDSGNDYNENGTVSAGVVTAASTDVAAPVKYWVVFSYFGTVSTRAWQFASSSDCDDAIALVNAAIGDDIEDS
jgi:hypothetical protein